MTKKILKSYAIPFSVSAVLSFFPFLLIQFGVLS